MNSFIDILFNISSKEEFEKIALKVFFYQYNNNPVYNKYIYLLKRDVNKIKSIKDIPFLPIVFYKTHNITCFSVDESYKVFLSSGTRSSIQSRHIIKDISLYQKSLKKCFEFFYGQIPQYSIFALMPDYSTNKSSSLIFMLNELIKLSKNEYSGFYSGKEDIMLEIIRREETGKKIIFGLSYCLYDLAKKYSCKLRDTIIIETGGMKGREREITRKELHYALKESFGVSEVHSEYSMTELLSQAYSPGDGRFFTPRWMKIFIRDIYDPFNYVEDGQRGGINIIDLANYHTCSFIETQDLGRKFSDNSFEVLGRFDYSELRGCSLLY